MSDAWSTACPDWQDRIRARRPLVPGLPLFREEADKAVRVFNRLRLPDVPGKPAMGEAAGEWFRDIVAAIFGSFDAETGRRMIQEIFLLVPKKNMKSTGAAGVMVTAAIVNRRPEAELLLVAPTKEIADIAFRQASGMIAADDDLAALFHVQRHVRTIQHRVSGALLQIKAADTDVITGGKQTYTLLDETHEFASKSRAADVFVELRGALAARPDGFLIQITTQSKRPPAGVFAAELRRARAVRDGKRRLPLLPILYELPEDLAADGGWKDEACFALVNPNLGRSVDPAFLRRELESAEEDGAAALALFASQHLNVEIGLALQSDHWVGADHWAGCADRELTLERLLERCDAVVVGVDGGGLDDLLGLAVIGRGAETGAWLHWAHAWADKGVLDRRKSIAPTLRDFERDGDLTITETSEDLAEAADLVADIDATGKLVLVGVDQSGTYLVVEALRNRDIDADKKVVGISQGWKLTGAIETLERKLRMPRAFRHAGQRLMAWCIGNARVEPRGNAVAITKQAAGSAKIDPLIATFMAAACMAQCPEPTRSYLDKHDLIMI